MIGIDVLVIPECPNADVAERRIREVAARLAAPVEIRRMVVADPCEAARLGFRGSPTVRIDGADLEPGLPPSHAFACRRYEGGAGVPPTWLIEARILRALMPRHVLFLCVANSARSQIAEGLARHRAPEGVRVSSAGSRPSRVRPHAIRVLAEVGIDASGHRSKGTDDVAAEIERGEAPPVDAVMTLCREEVCPVWLGDSRRLHWPLPDPAVATGSEDEVLSAFRLVRDEMSRRLDVVFGD